jgi:hypothetical protein
MHHLFQWLYCLGLRIDSNEQFHSPNPEKDAGNMQVGSYSVQASQKVRCPLFRLMSGFGPLNAAPPTCVGSAQGETAKPADRSPSSLAGKSLWLLCFILQYKCLLGALVILLCAAAVSRCFRSEPEPEPEPEGFFHKAYTRIEFGMTEEQVEKTVGMGPGNYGIGVNNERTVERQGPLGSDYQRYWIGNDEELIVGYDKCQKMQFKEYLRINEEVDKPSLLNRLITFVKSFFNIWLRKAYQARSKRWFSSTGAEKRTQLVKIRATSSFRRPRGMEPVMPYLSQGLYCRRPRIDSDGELRPQQAISYYLCTS